ncbi:MAG: hypothetical protein KAV42_05820 [Candidatus Krumholzibacteria bacterium]|nr:hypothetical protein [Candidatus Krumholzibacteria bacterium]
MLTLYHKRIRFLAVSLLILSSLSCAEDVVFPGEDRGEWTNVPSVREDIRSSISAIAEGPGGELYLESYWDTADDGTGLILFTDDAGLTWDRRGKGMNPEGWIVDLEVLKDGTVFACKDRNGVFRSCDRGMTWKQVNNRLTDLDMVSIVTIPDGRLLVSTDFGGLFFSSDRGDTWEQCLSDSIFNYRPILETDHNGGIVYVAYSDKVFYSEDNCATWDMLPAMPGDTHYYVSDLWVDGEGTLYLPMNSKLLKYSADEGWVDITPEYSGYILDDFMIDDEGGLYTVHRDQYVMWSGDQGNSWQVKDWFTTGMCLSEIFSNRGCLFLATVGHNSMLYRSCDEGSTWQCAGTDDSYILDLLVDSSGSMIGRTQLSMYRMNGLSDLWTLFWLYDENRCGQGSYPNLARTALCPDGDILFSMCGLTRVPGEGGPGFHIMGEDTLVVSIEVDPAGMIFLATVNGVMRSLDNGGSWETVLPEQTKVLELEANVDSTVYLATENGLMISEDYGSTWETRIDSLVITAITSDSDGMIYAGVEGGIMFSVDRGRNWEMIWLDGYLETPRTLEMSSGGRVVALTSHRKLYLIEKGCADYRVIFSELPQDIRILIGEDGYLYYFERQIFRFSVPVDML